MPKERLLPNRPKVKSIELGGGADSHLARGTPAQGVGQGGRSLPGPAPALFGASTGLQATGAAAPSAGSPQGCPPGAPAKRARRGFPAPERPPDGGAEGLRGCTSVHTTETRRHFPATIAGRGGCGRTFRVLTHQSCGAKVLVPVRCGDRFRCRPCARIAAQRQVRSFRPRLEAMAHPMFLTLTIKSVPLGELRAAVSRLMSAWGRLRHRKIFKGVRGGVWSLEVTYSRENGWHPHLHAIIDGGYIPQAVLSREWLEITGDSRIVDIRAVKRLHSAARELLKYVTKPWELGEGELGELASVFTGRRRSDSWGSAREVPLDKEPPLCCPRCGEPVRFRDWELEVVDLAEARRQFYRGGFWADFYPSWGRLDPPALAGG